MWSLHAQRLSAKVLSVFLHRIEHLRETKSWEWGLNWKIRKNYVPMDQRFAGLHHEERHMQYWVLHVLWPSVSVGLSHKIYLAPFHTGRRIKYPRLGRNRYQSPVYRYEQWEMSLWNDKIAGVLDEEKQESTVKFLGAMLSKDSPTCMNDISEGPIYLDFPCDFGLDKGSSRDPEKCSTWSMTYM